MTIFQIGFTSLHPSCSETSNHHDTHMPPKEKRRAISGETWICLKLDGTAAVKTQLNST